MSERHRTTEAQFRLFKAEVERLVKRFGVNDWRVDFAHEQVQARAELRTDVVGRVLVFVLSTDWGVKNDGDGEPYVPTREAVLAAARHEVVHALCQPLIGMCAARWVTRDEHDAAAESVARRIEAAIGTGWR